MVDFEFTAVEFGVESEKKKIVFIVYNPNDNTNGKERTTFQFKKNVMKKRITMKTGINQNLMELTIQRHSDVTHDYLVSKIR